MKFGLPIVANDVGGIKEIVIHGKNGYLTEGRDVLQMADNVTSILSSAELYGRMSTQSIDLIIPFGVTAMIHKTMDLYSEILEM